MHLEGRKREFKDDIDKMKLSYAEKINPLDTLINIQKDFPSDIVIAKALAKRLSTSFMTEKQRMLLEYLIQEYKLDKKDFVKPGKESVKKPSYNVAVIFPFMSKETNPSLIKNNQYVNDLYQGMRIAVDSLKKAGVNINLFAYDSEKEESKLGEILNFPEVKGMDLIIGPLYPVNFNLVNDFANRNQILVVNPLSNNSNLVEGNPFVYLFQPSLKAFAGQAADYARKNFPYDDKAKQVIIFQSPTSKDSLASMYFRDSIVSKGFEVKNHMVVTRENMNDAKKLLDSMKLVPVSHIFISSSDQILAANIISAMEISKRRTPLMVSPEWLQFSLLTYDQYERNEVHVLLPEFIDYNGTAIYSFKKSYYSKTTLLPTTQVIQGYELLKYFGGALGKYGNYFVSGIQKEGFTSGSVFQGYNFTLGNSNGFVPVVKFYESNLKVLNNPLFPPVFKEEE